MTKCCKNSEEEKMLLIVKIIKGFIDEWEAEMMDTEGWVRSQRMEISIFHIEWGKIQMHKIQNTPGSWYGAVLLEEVCVVWIKLGKGRLGSDFWKS